MKHDALQMRFSLLYWQAQIFSFVGAGMFMWSCLLVLWYLTRANSWESLLTMPVPLNAVYGLVLYLICRLLILVMQIVHNTSRGE